MCNIASKIFTPEKKFLCEIIQNKYGIRIDEKKYLKSCGKEIVFSNLNNSKSFKFEN